MPKEKYLFGPVPSRRLGYSLGVDIVPFKVCTLDCLYCQLGKTTQITIERKNFVPVDQVIEELKNRLAADLKADYITISGSGEPTLNSSLGNIIDKIKSITNIPVALITNSTLLYKPDVRTQCAKADLILPSLDAGDETTYRKINRPHPDITIEKLVSGLINLRMEYQGSIWLEVFLIDGINTAPDQIAKINKIIRQINPDKIQLNTAVRPTAQGSINRLDEQKMQSIARQLGDKCEVVADFSATAHCSGLSQSKIETALSMLKRRPCSIEDVCKSLDLKRNEALKYLADLQQKGLITSEKRDSSVYYLAL